LPVIYILEKDLVVRQFLKRDYLIPLREIVSIKKIDSTPFSIASRLNYQLIQVQINYRIGGNEYEIEFYYELLKNNKLNILISAIKNENPFLSVSI
jgi:hypothetical protein